MITFLSNTLEQAKPSPHEIVHNIAFVWCFVVAKTQFKYIGLSMKIKTFNLDLTLKKSALNLEKGRLPLLSPFSTELEFVWEGDSPNSAFSTKN